MDNSTLPENTEGWKIADVTVFPLATYSTELAWLKHFAECFPTRGKRILKIIRRHNNVPSAITSVTQEVVKWLDKIRDQYEERR